MNDAYQPDVDSDEALEEILRRAGPRPRPSETARLQAYESLHAQWQASVRQRRRRWTPYLAFAATLLIAGLVNVQWFAAPSTAEVRQLEVLRANGSRVFHNDRQYSVAAIVDRSITLAAGDELATAGDTRTALDWDRGSLRLNEATRIRLEDAETLTLLHGAIYFDSVPSSNIDERATIRIATDLGTISHSGTQFQVSYSGAALEVSVREGEVRVAGDRVDVTLVRGEGMRLSPDGRFERRLVNTYDAGWQWATDIAPERDIEGRTTAEVLNWVARETGREIRFASDAARALAESEPRGIASLAPMAALRTIPYMTSLQYRETGPYIVIDVSKADRSLQEE